MSKRKKLFPGWRTDMAIELLATYRASQSKTRPPGERLYLRGRTAGLRTALRILIRQTRAMQQSLDFHEHKPTTPPMNETQP